MGDEVSQGSLLQEMDNSKGVGLDVFLNLICMVVTRKEDFLYAHIGKEVESVFYQWRIRKRQKTLRGQDEHKQRGLKGCKLTLGR